MKIIYSILFSLFAFITVAQNKTIGYEISQSSPESYDKLINESTLTIGRNVYNAFSIVYDGDINAFVNKLKIDLKNVEIVSDEKTHKRIYFKNFRKFEWNGNKITLKFESISNLNRHMITIICFDDDNKDLLEPGSQTKEKIKQYLADRLK